MANNCFGTVYTVQPGDTLWLISVSQGISVDKIMEANPTINPYNLQTGQQICIPSNCQGIIYTIKAGDTLWLISIAHGVSVEKILAANPNVEPQNLQAGIQICVPTGTVIQPTPPVSPPIPSCQGTLHTFRSGDNLWLIAQEHGTSVDEILAANPNLNPDNIQIGQQICIPSTVVFPPFPPIPPSCQGIVYTVRPGDTFWTISQAHNVPAQDIIDANPNINPDNLQTGQHLCIPTTKVVPPAVNRESLTYLYGNNSDHYLGMLAKTQDSIKTAVPDFFELSSVGNLLLASPDKLNAQFIEVLHSQGMKIVPFISNHWNRTLGEIALDNRENLSNQIVAAITEYNLDGVDVDIENVTDQYRLQYTDFVRLLRQKLPSDKVVSVAVAANPYGWTTGWHGSYDYPALAQYADYLMIMNYDESYQGGPEGPVSSSNFFNRSIQFALNQGVPKEKIVVGIPFFGRYWKVGDATGGFGIAAMDVDNLLKNYISTSRFDEPTKSSYAEVTIRPGQPEPIIWGNRKLTAGTYHIWYDGPEATHYKLNVIDGYDLKGAGSWALGQEIPTIWNFYTAALNNEIIVPPPEPPIEPQPPELPAPEPPEVPEPPVESPVPPIPSVPNNQKIINILKEAGDPRNITVSTHLTRGEVAVALAKFANLSLDTTSNASYTDISNYWGRGYINALHNYGILKDLTGNMFNPNTTASKEDIAVMFSRILDLPDLANLPSLSFRDLEPSRWSYKAISKMYYLNLMEGQNQNFFRPTNPMTVNEIAKILDAANTYGYGFRRF